MENLLNTTDLLEKDLSLEELVEYLHLLGFINIAGETLEFDDHEWVVDTKPENGVGFNNGYTAVNTEKGEVWVAKGQLSQNQFNKIAGSFGWIATPSSVRAYGNNSVPLGLGGHLKNQEIQIKDIQSDS